MTDITDQPPIPGAHVLVVDDELQVRSALVRSLSLLGYRADAACDGNQALKTLERTSYDLMVLDICMPGLDGVQVMQQARQMHPDLAIIVLTGHAALDSAIAAVKSGAVDYLHKPASTHDIAAAAARALRPRAEHLHQRRLLAVMEQALNQLRGVKATEETAPIDDPEYTLCSGRVALDLEKRRAVVAASDDTDARHAELTGDQAELLAYLMRHPGAVLSCHELAQDALGYDVSTEEAQNIVRPHIYRLRRKLEADPREPRLIRTVHGRGYFFAG
jgi:DNA-binding response OmpR family regulator